MSNHEKGVRKFPIPANDENGDISATMHPNQSFLTGNLMSGPGEGFGIGPGFPKRRKKQKNRVLAPLGLLMDLAALVCVAAALLMQLCVLWAVRSIIPTSVRTDSHLQLG